MTDAKRWAAWCATAVAGALLADGLLAMRPPIRRLRIQTESRDKAVGASLRAHVGVRPSRVVPSPAGSRPSADNSDGATNPGEVVMAPQEPGSSVAPTEEVPSPAARARVQGAEIVTGHAGSVMLLASENIVDGALPLRKSTPVAQIHAEYKRRLSEGLERESALGPPPWADDQFQVFGLVAEQSFAVLGRQVPLPASTGNSVDWYARQWGIVPTDAGRESAIAVMRDYEEKDRALRVKVQELMLERVKSRTRETREVVAYSVIGRAVVLLTQSELPGLRAYAEDLGTIRNRAMNRAEEVTR